MDVATFCFAHARSEVDNPNDIKYITQCVEHDDNDAAKVGITCCQTDLYQELRLVQDWVNMRAYKWKQLTEHGEETDDVESQRSQSEECIEPRRLFVVVVVL